MHQRDLIAENPLKLRLLNTVSLSLEMPASLSVISQSCHVSLPLSMQMTLTGPGELVAAGEERERPAIQYNCKRDD